MFIEGKIAKGWRGVGGLVVQVRLVEGRQYASLCGVRLRFELMDTDATRHRVQSKGSQVGCLVSHT